MVGKADTMKYYFPTTDDDQTMSRISNFYSVEFATDSPHPVYQFKLWHSEHNNLFLLVKDNSVVLSQLRVGHVLPMKFYSDDALHPTQVRETQIREIVNETQGRFKGHHRIELEIVEPASEPLVH